MAMTSDDAKIVLAELAERYDMETDDMQKLSDIAEGIGAAPPPDEYKEKYNALRKQYVDRFFGRNVDVKREKEDEPSGIDIFPDDEEDEEIVRGRNITVKDLFK